MKFSPGVSLAGRSSDVFDGGDDEEIVPSSSPVKKQSSSHVAGLLINFQDSDDDSDWEVEASKKRKVSATAKTGSVKKKKGNGMSGKTVEQHRTSLRLKVAKNIKVAGGPGKWHCKATCHSTSTITVDAFKAVLEGARDTTIFPAQFDANTELVVAEVMSHAGARSVLGEGRGQLDAGTSWVHRDGSSSSWELDRMDMVYNYKPKTKELNIWWTMGGGH